MRVERAEHADHQPREDEESAHVLVDALGDHLPGGDDHDHGDERREQHEPERDAVQPQVVEHVEAVDPRLALDELHLGGAELEAAVQRQRDQEADDGADERQPAHGARMLVPPQGKQHGAEQDRRPDG
jgi:hypothetical protein